MVRTHTEEAPETQDRIGDPAVGFIDHEALDLPYALTTRVIHRSSFNPVACDEGGCGSALRHCCALHCGRHKVVSSNFQPLLLIRCDGAHRIDSRQFWKAIANSNATE
jgi:hypothetical protein